MDFKFSDKVMSKTFYLSGIDEGVHYMEEKLFFYLSLYFDEQPYTDDSFDHDAKIPWLVVGNSNGIDYEFLDPFMDNLAEITNQEEYKDGAQVKLITVGQNDAFALSNLDETKFLLFNNLKKKVVTKEEAYVEIFKYLNLCANDMFEECTKTLKEIEDFLEAAASHISCVPPSCIKQLKEAIKKADDSLYEEV